MGGQKTSNTQYLSLLLFLLFAHCQTEFTVVPSAGSIGYIGKQMNMETNEPSKLDNLIFGEVQVLLAEKRTALASLRTGTAVFAFPLSVLSVLIATSR